MSAPALPIVAEKTYQFMFEAVVDQYAQVVVSLECSSEKANDAVRTAWRHLRTHGARDQAGELIEGPRIGRAQLLDMRRVDANREPQKSQPTLAQHARRMRAPFELPFGGMVG